MSRKNTHLTIFKKLCYRMFYSPFRFFFKNSDNLGQKVVNFSLGPPSPPYSLLKCDAYGETCPCTFYLFLAFFNIEYRPFRNFRYVIVTCCHYARICLSREWLAQTAVTSETGRPTDLKEARFTEFVSSSY